MSNGNGVSNTISNAMDSMSGKAQELGEAIAKRAAPTI